MVKRPPLARLRELLGRGAATIVGGKVLVEGQGEWEIVLTEDGLQAIRGPGGTLLVLDPGEDPKPELAARRRSHLERALVPGDGLELPHDDEETDGRGSN